MEQDSEQATLSIISDVHRWKVPIVDIGGGTRVETAVLIDAETPVQARCAVQELPDAPVGSRTLA